MYIVLSSTCFTVFIFCLVTPMTRCTVDLLQACSTNVFHTYSKYVVGKQRLATKDAFLF